MSYFTDDTIDDSTTEPLIVDPKNMPSERLDFGQHVYQRGKQIFATDHLLSPLINADSATDERRKLIEDHAGENLDDIVKHNGFDPGFGAPGDEAYEDAIEQYKQTLPNELKARIFTREGLKHRAKELGRKKHDDANKNLERSNHGIFADLVGGLGAYSADPLFLATQVLAPEIAFARLAAKGVQLSQKGRIGARAGIDAVAGAGYEIPLQLGVIQPYKGELGLKHDNMDVANAVFAATVLGGVLGGTVEGVAGAYRKVKTGEWTPKQADKFIAENYDKLTPEQKEIVDMSIQAMDHELSNPYGPSPEGRARHNKEVAEEYKRLDTFERPLTETDIKANKELLERAQSPEELEFQELRAEAIREAGILGTARQAEATAQQIEVNPLEAQIRSLTDGLEVGDELAVGTLARVGLDEAQAREVLAYAVRSGIITKDADGKITLAKRVNDSDNPVVEGDSRLEELEARQLESEEPNAKPTDNNRTALKINNDDFVIEFDGEKFTPEQLIKSADNDIAQAENLKLCVLMGGR